MLIILIIINYCKCVTLKLQCVKVVFIWICDKHNCDSFIHSYYFNSPGVSMVCGSGAQQFSQAFGSALARTE